MNEKKKDFYVKLSGYTLSNKEILKLTFRDCMSFKKITNRYFKSDIIVRLITGGTQRQIRRKSRQLPIGRRFSAEFCWLLYIEKYIYICRKIKKETSFHINTWHITMNYILKSRKELYSFVSRLRKVCYQLCVIIMQVI